MKKSQAILEVTVVFVVGLFLFFGIMGMWMWGDNQIAKRQPEYNQTRVEAGSVVTINDKPIVYPVYQPDKLSEEDVFGLQRQEDKTESVEEKTETQ